MFTLDEFRKLVHGTMDERVRMLATFVILICFGFYTASTVHWAVDPSHTSVHPLEWAAAIAFAIVAMTIKRVLP